MDGLNIKINVPRCRYWAGEVRFITHRLFSSYFLCRYSLLLVKVTFGHLVEFLLLGMKVARFHSFYSLVTL